MARISQQAHRVLVEERQEQILAAAAKVFAKKGFERATIRDIAKEAHVSEGSIYNYFKNKYDLLISIPTQFVHPVVDALTAEIFHASGEPRSPQATLTEIARTMVSTFQDNGHIFRILLSAVPAMNQASRDKYAEQVVMYVAKPLEAFFAAQIKQGTFRSDLDPSVAARVFIGMFFPYVMLQTVLMLGGPPPNYDLVIPQAVQVFMQGAVAVPERANAHA